MDTTVVLRFAHDRRVMRVEAGIPRALRLGVRSVACDL
jgi:hypothetical protein